MPVSALDSRIFRDQFGTEEIRRVFDDENYARCMIDVETALARAQSKLNVIPPEAGDILTQSCDVANLDFDRLSRETEIVGYPVLPLIKQLNEMSTKEAAKYIHWGATTQDIMDTASVLQIREGLAIVHMELTRLRDTLSAMSRKFRNSPMAGRTHMQHALPITFGYKCAVYLSSICRHLDRLEDLKPRILVAQLGGAAGTLASLGNKGLQVREAFASELKLGTLSVTWHVARDGIAEVVGVLAMIGGSLAKIALDIILMSSNEVAEVSEPFIPHRGASSTMPQKRNPIGAELILAASKMLRANAGLTLDAMVSDFERASGPWHLEWSAVPESFVLLCGALHQSNFVLSGLVVNEKKMEENLDGTKGLIVAEAVMMKLGPIFGRQAAHDLVYETCCKCVEADRPLVEVLLENSKLKDHLSSDEIRQLCTPSNYLGSSGSMVDAMVV